MAKAIYEGVGGVARKVKKAYEGIGGVARQVKNGWIGVGGVARQFFSGGLITLLEELPSSAVSYSIETGTYDGYNQNLGYTKLLRIKNDGSASEFMMRLHGDFAGKSYSFAGQSGSMWSYLRFTNSSENKISQTSIKYTSVITTASGTIPSSTKYIDLRVVRPDNKKENSLRLYEFMIGEYNIMEEIISILNVSS